MLPGCKKNNEGRIISTPEELKCLYLDTYVHRLRHRPAKDDFKPLKLMKEILFSKRLELVKMNKSQPWEMIELEKVLSKLKNDKARDPHGWINEIFKLGVIGTDLKLSLLLMFNRIKIDMNFPDLMKYANISSIYKGKGEKTNLSNDRGIFNITVLRSIFMKLIYNDNYEALDSSMSDYISAIISL